MYFTLNENGREKAARRRTTRVRRGACSHGSKTRDPRWRLLFPHRAGRLVLVPGPDRLGFGANILGSLDSDPEADRLGSSTVDLNPQPIDSNLALIDSNLAPDVSDPAPIDADTQPS